MGLGAMSHSPVVLPVLGEDNYDFWKIKMKTLLRSHNLWSYVEVGFVEPENEESLSAAHRRTLEEDRMMDAKALVFLQQGVSDALFPRILCANSAKEAWDILEREFEVEESELQSLRREFDSLQMQESEDIKDYFVRVFELAQEMRSCGEVIDDEMVLKKIVCTLPSGSIMKLIGSVTRKYEHLGAIPANETKSPSYYIGEPFMGLVKYNGPHKIDGCQTVEIGIQAENESQRVDLGVQTEDKSQTAGISVQTEEDGFGFNRQEVGARNEINGILKLKGCSIPTEGDQQVLFADKVLEYTGKGKIKKRHLIVSEFAIYIVDPDSFALKRRIALAAVDKIFMSELHDHFIAIHIPTEYDILLASTRKNEIAAKLVEATRGSPDYELQVIRSNRFEYNASAELVKEVHNELIEGHVKTRFVRAEAA